VSRGADAYATLVEMLRQNPGQARRLAAEHAVDEHGRCKTCRAGADSSGRSHGCRIGDAARRALETEDDPHG
jgi:hypothetical protein